MSSVTRHPVTLPHPCFYRSPVSATCDLGRIFNCYFNTKHAVWAQVMVHLDSCNILLHFSTGSTASSNPVSLEIQLILDHVSSVCRFHLLSKLLRDFIFRKNNGQSLLGGAAVPPRFRIKWYSHSEYTGLKLPLTCC